MLKAREKLQRLEREEKDDRAMDRQMDSIGGLRIVRGAVSTDIPDDGPPGVKRKVKVHKRVDRASARARGTASIARMKEDIKATILYVIENRGFDSPPLYIKPWPRTTKPWIESR